MPGLIEEEVLTIPSRFHFFEMLRPVPDGKIRLILRLTDALKTSDRLTGFALSNLGNIAINDSDAPFRVKDLRLFVHSFKTKALGLITYTLNGEMRFNCVADEKCMSHAQTDLLKREFMAVLEREVVEAGDGASVTPHMLAAVAE
jgi:hypothetical protein